MAVLTGDEQRVRHPLLGSIAAYPKQKLSSRPLEAPQRDETTLLILFICANCHGTFWRWVQDPTCILGQRQSKHTCLWQTARGGTCACCQWDLCDLLRQETKHCEADCQVPQDCKLSVYPGCIDYLMLQLLQSWQICIRKSFRQGGPVGLAAKRLHVLVVSATSVAFQR